MVQTPFSVLKPVVSSNEAAYVFPAAQVQYKESVAAIVQVEFGPLYAGAEVGVESRQLEDGCLFTSWIGPEGAVLAGGPLARAPEATVKLDSEGRAFLIVVGIESCRGGRYLVEAHLDTAPYIALGAWLTAPEPPPLVTGLSPNHGSASGGTTVTIGGRGFVDGTQWPFTPSEVYFGAAWAANVTVNSSSSITAEAPPGAGTVDVTVRNEFPNKGTSPTHPPDQYTYVPGSPPSPPTSLSISVINGAVGASWKPPAKQKGGPLTGYLLTVTPVGNNRVPKPAAPLMS